MRPPSSYFNAGGVASVSVSDVLEAWPLMLLLSLILARALVTNRFAVGPSTPSTPSLSPLLSEEELSRLLSCLRRAVHEERRRQKRVYAFSFALLASCALIGEAPVVVGLMRFLSRKMTETMSGEHVPDELLGERAKNGAFLVALFTLGRCGSVLAPILILRPTDRTALRIVLGALIIFTTGICLEVIRFLTLPAPPATALLSLPPHVSHQVGIELFFTLVPLALAGLGMPSASLRVAILLPSMVTLCGYTMGARRQFDALVQLVDRNPRQALAQAQSACTRMTGISTFCLSIGIALELLIVATDKEPNSPYADLYESHHVLIFIPACVFFFCVTLTSANRGRLRRLIGEWGLGEVNAQLRPTQHLASPALEATYAYILSFPRVHS